MIARFLRAAGARLAVPALIPHARESLHHGEHGFADSVALDNQRGHSSRAPLGRAVENVDAIGGGRPIARVPGGVGNDPPVDASGKLPDGRIFTNPAEFKKLLAGDERLARAFLEQLATYALRRVMTVDDMEGIQSIAKATHDEGHGVKTLTRQLILSDLFQKRQGLGG